MNTERPLSSRHRCLESIALLASVLWVQSSLCQTVHDSGFENIVGYTFFQGQQQLGSWMVGSGAAAVVNAGFGRPHSGSQIMVMPLCATQMTACVSQLVDGFIPGGRYQLSFFSSIYRNASFTGEVAAVVAIGPARIEFDYPGDVRYATFGTESPWSLRTCEFVATAAQLRLKILARHGGRAGFIGFDDFSIQPLSIPEWPLVQSQSKPEAPDAACIPEEPERTPFRLSDWRTNIPIHLAVDLRPTTGVDAPGTSTNRLELRWLASPRLAFDIEQSANLKVWKPLPANIQEPLPGEYRAETSIDSSAALFYRVRVRNR